MYDTVLSSQWTLYPECPPSPGPVRPVSPARPPSPASPRPDPSDTGSGIRMLDGSNLEGAFIELLLTLRETGGNALIIDALSVTNPHSIVRVCKRLGLDYREYLDRILIERPFTAYQMTSVIGELLPKWIREDNISVIMGVGLFSLLQDPDLGDLYRQWGKGLIMRRLKVATRHFGLTTFLLSDRGRGGRGFSHGYPTPPGFGK